MDYTNKTHLAINAAMQAGELLCRGFTSQFTVSEKEGCLNLVTEYDLKSEESIISYLQKGSPDASFLSEEKGSIEGSDELWIIDPLDGTVNFAHGIPVFAISIAMQVEKDTKLGVVYQPITKEMFVAEKGKGAYLNGRKINVSQTNLLEKSLLSTGLPYNLKDNPHHCIEALVKVLKKGLAVRRLGAAAIDLAYLAAGRFDVFFEANLQPWDIAAAQLIIEEAGGVLSNWKGEPFNLFQKQPLLASNGQLHEQVLKLWE